MPNDPLVLLVLVALQNVVLIVITLVTFWIGVFLIRLFGGRAGYSLRALGLSRPSPGLLKGIGLGLLVGIGALVASTVVSAITATLLRRLGYSSENSAQEPLMLAMRGYVSDDAALAVPLIVGVVLILAPIAEELLFRGAIFGGLSRLGLLVLRRSHGKEASAAGRWVALAPAAVVSSVFFSLLHLSPVILPAIFILALLLCWLYQRTGSLLPGMVAHATFNSFAVLLLILGGLGVFDIPS